MNKFAFQENMATATPFFTGRTKRPSCPCHHHIDTTRQTLGIPTIPTIQSSSPSSPWLPPPRPQSPSPHPVRRARSLPPSASEGQQGPEGDGIRLVPRQRRLVQDHDPGGRRGKGAGRSGPRGRAAGRGAQEVMGERFGRRMGFICGTFAWESGWVRHPCS